MVAQPAPTTRTSKVLHLMLGTGAIQAGAITVFIAFARLLGQTEFGTWRQLFVVNQVAQALIFSAVPMSLLRFAGQADPGSVCAIIRQHVVLTMGIGALAILILFFSADQIAALLGNEQLSLLLRLFAPQVAAVMIVALVGPALVVMSRTSLSSWFSLATAGFTTLSLLVAALGGADLRGLVIVSVSVSVLMGVLAAALLFHVTKIGGVTGSKGAPSLTHVTAFLWPLLLASGIGLLGLRMDHAIVSNRLGPEIYAVYAVGAFEVPVFGLLQSSVSAVLLPQFSALAKTKDWSSIVALWKTALIRSAIVVFPVAAMLIVLSEDFIAVVFGEKYLGAALIFQLYLLLAPLRIMTFGLVLRAAGNNKPDLYGAIGYFVAVTVFVLLGVHLAETAGAMLAVVVCTFGLALYLALETKRMTLGNIKLFEIYPPALFPIFFIIVFVFYIVLKVLPWVSGLPPLFSLSVGATMALALTGLGVVWMQRKHNRIK